MSNLNETEIHALHEALDDEYRAWATYDQVIADFGEVLPFRNIREAEAPYSALRAGAPALRRPRRTAAPRRGAPGSIGNTNGGAGVRAVDVGQDCSDGIRPTSRSLLPKRTASGSFAMSPLRRSFR
jgi:hypothetical protein